MDFQRLSINDLYRQLSVSDHYIALCYAFRLASTLRCAKVICVQYYRQRVTFEAYEPASARFIKYGPEMQGS